MTFHLAPSNPLIITAAAEAQRLHLCCISGCHGKKKKKSSIPHPFCADREKTIFLLEEIEGLRVKNTENQWQLLVCVCLCVC